MEKKAQADAVIPLDLDWGSKFAFFPILWICAEADPKPRKKEQSQTFLFSPIYFLQSHKSCETPTPQKC